MEFCIEINGLKKYFGLKKAVEDVSLQIKEGEIFGLLGPSGAGKRQSLNC